MKPLIIGFGHKAYQGKDTACQAIIDARGGDYNIRRYSFASALKQEVVAMVNQRTLCEMIGIEYDEHPSLADPLLPPPHGKQRRLLQWWGTEFRRAQDRDYWVKRTYCEIMDDCPQVALISDMRFLNEFQMVKDAGGTTVRMVRTDSGPRPTVMDHISETQLDGAPYDNVIAADSAQRVRILAINLFDALYPSQ